MGASWSSTSTSSRRRNENPNTQNRNHSSSNTQQPIYPSYRIQSHPPIPPPSSSSPPPTQPQPQPQQNYMYPANQPYPSHQNPYTVHPPQPYYYQPYAGGYGAFGPGAPLMVRPGYSPYQHQHQHQHYYGNQGNGWVGMRPFQPVPVQPQLPPPPFVDHQSAKKIRNDVNVLKDSIRVEVDGENSVCHVVSFTLDAMVDGSITIFYFAKEGADHMFSPLYPDAHTPVKLQFQKGLGQKILQPSGTGIDLNFFAVDDLSKPSPGEDIFPLVIIAEAWSETSLTEEQENQRPPTSNAQITQAVLEKNSAGLFQVKVIKQILSVDGVRYELREIYGIGNSDKESFDDNDPGKECVICMSEPKDTAILPCRHMCICSECAKELRLQTNKCPICRQPIEELIGIKVSNSSQ